MGGFSIWHWLIVLVVILVLFGGRGRISQIMGDFGKGLKSFKRSIKDEDGQDEDAPFTVEPPKALKSETASTAAGETARQGERTTKS